MPALHRFSFMFYVFTYFFLLIIKYFLHWIYEDNSWFVVLFLILISNIFGILHSKDFKKIKSKIVENRRGGDKQVRHFFPDYSKLLTYGKYSELFILFFQFFDFSYCSNKYIYKPSRLPNRKTFFHSQKLAIQAIYS